MRSELGQPGVWTRVARGAALVALVAASATPALAHSGHGGESGFAHGLAHPPGGWDHLAAMVGVGLWAGLQGGSRVWVLPVAFVAGVLGGALLALGGMAFTATEAVIVASVVAVAAAIGLRARVSAGIGAGIVFAFALAHGYAHGIEAPGEGLAGYMAGFTASTALLHVAGLAVAMLAARFGLGWTGRRATSS